MATMTTVPREPRRTGRGASRQMNVNNTRVPPSGNMRRNGSSSQTNQMQAEGIYSNERMVYGLISMLGCSVTLHVRNGSVYEGVLSTVGPKMEILLSAGTLLKPGTNGQASRPQSREVMNMIFKPNDIVCISASNVDFDASRDSFLDSSIGRNGQSVEREMKPLEPWEAGSSEDASYTLDPSANGWDASEMFRKNAERFDVKSTYDENLSQYTTPLVRKNDQDYRRREEEAERLAREIENSDDYKARIALENGDKDEESKFSAVVRSGEGGANPNRYVPPNRRPAIPSNHQNVPPHQGPPVAVAPASAREKRPWENHRPAVTNPPLQPCMQPAVNNHAAQRRPEVSDQRVNGDVTKDRKSSESDHSRAQKPSPVSIPATAPPGSQHHTGSQPLSPQLQSSPPVNLASHNHIHHQAGAPPLVPPPPHNVQALPPVSSIQQPNQLPGVATAAAAVPLPASGSIPQTSAPVPSGSVEKPEPCPASPTSQVQTQTSQPPERKSPRDKEKLEYLKDFQRNFKLEDAEEHKAERVQEKKAGQEEKKEEEKPDNKIFEKVVHSNLNPNAKEFKPASYGMKPGPAPSPTPPRQSPVIHHPPSVVPVGVPNLLSKFGIITAGHQTMPQNKTYPKRAVVSVQPDPMLATGQPLLAAQPSLPAQYLFQVPLPQGAASTIQVMPSRLGPPNSVHMSHQAMDPNQVSGQPTHSPHQIFVAQQAHGPIPAHMGAHHGAQTMTHPQPAHTHMQQHQQHHPAAVPPGAQSQSGQITPHPSASPVQHLGPSGPNTGGPQPHHAHQGVPPTSGTPQPSLSYGQQIGLQGHPPLQPTHAHPAHMHVGLGSSNHQSLHHVPMNYMTHTLQAGGGQLPFNQTGPSGGSGPGPAHVPHTPPMGQYNVVVMPQPPPHTVNQASLANPHHGHQYQQHHVPAPSQLHNTAGQAHALLPGSMSTAIPVSGTGLVSIHHSQLPHFGPPGLYQRMPCPVEVQGKEPSHP